MKNKILSFFLSINLCITPIFAAQAPNIYLELNKTTPFVVSFGTAMSQTHQSANTAHPDFMREKLQKLAQQSTDARKFLGQSDHIGYVLRALPNTTCQKCGNTINPTTLDLKNDKQVISHLLDDAFKNITAPQLTITSCPSCAGALTELPRKEIKLTSDRQQAMLSQINGLGVKNQVACTKYGLPTYRISLDASDVLSKNSTDTDQAKLQTQAAFLKQIGNPLIFCHHYANPQTIPDLFEKSEHVTWFANYCASIAKASPQITHICPISQPVGFAHRVSRATLSPFSCNISLQEYLKNITQAQVCACKQMKEINPNLKVLMSHQWKPFKPLHGKFNGWYLLECLVCSIASNMYNGAFVKMLQPHQDLFDGIALSVYPALKFNGWIPQGDNCAGTFNADDALEAIMQTHQAFPNKDIYIVETGCNTIDPQTKRDFIDMTLHVCKIARDQGIKVQGVYFWGHTNDPEFYSEWNMQPGSTHFAPFDKLDVTNPCDSINTAGRYLQEIVAQT